MDWMGPLPLLPPFLCWNPHSSYDDTEGESLWEVITFRWGHDGGALMMELCFYEKEKRHQRSSLEFLLYERTERRWLPSNQEEDYQHTPALLAPFLDVPMSRTMRSMCFSHPAYGMLVLEAWTDEDKIIPCLSTENDFCHYGFRFRVAAV